MAKPDRVGDRGAEQRASRERLLWRFRAAATVFAAAQTLVRSGDHVVLGWVNIAALAVSVAVAGAALRPGASDAVVRRVGRWSMVVDLLVVAVILANNQTDPAEPIYLIAILPQVEATIRWPRRGGVIAGFAAGVAACVWTISVYLSLGQDPEFSYATMRLGTIVALGVFLGLVVRQTTESRDALQRILDISRDLIVVLDRSGRVVSVNSACQDILGYRPEQVMGRDARDFVHPDDRALNWHESALSRRHDDPQLLERRFVAADGAVRWLELNIVPSATGPLHITARDVTDRRQAQRLIAESEQRFRSLFEHNTDAIYAFDREGRFTLANPATETVVGYAPADLVGTSFAQLIAPEHLERTLRHFSAAAGGEAQNYETVCLHREGRMVDLDVTNTPIVVDGEVVGVFGVAKDVTARRMLERQLGHRATHDSLTGIPNRAHLEHVLLLDDDDQGTDRTLLFIDLDRFKLVNDSLGHRCGDEVLTVAVQRLARHVRNDDLLARWAGDEFCVLLESGTDDATALAIAHRLLEVLAEPFRVGGCEIRLSASIGVARGEAGDGAENLLRAADSAMYDAKRAGRNRVSVHDASLENLAGPTQFDVENELRSAIADRALSLHYQPIVELSTGRIVAVESLVRWPLADGTLRMPDSFIPMAEETGLVRDLTRLVLEEACRQVAAWDRMSPASQVCAWVNVSAADLQDQGILDDVDVALERSGLAPDRLVLEVTETMLLQDDGQVDRTVQGLRGAGVTLVIDDFGTGYSSMRQLHRLDVTACKIDRSFVGGAPTNDRDRAVIRSLANLGREFGFDVVGEGVETVDELDVLREAGCELAQGYLLARPAPADVIAGLIVRGRVDLPGSPTSAGQSVTHPAAG